MTADSLLFVRRARCQFWLVLGVIAGLVGLAGSVFAAQSVNLTWNRSTTTNVVAYKVYWGTQSQVYPNSVAFGVVTNVIIPGLAAGTTYYFAVTAATTNGNESAFSNEAVYTTTNNSSTSITLVVQSSTQALGAVQLTWTADSGSDVYGYSINYWTQGSGYTNSVQFYGVTNGLISGLSTGTNYFFTVSPIDDYGIEAVASAVVSFTVPNPTPIVLKAQPASKTSGVQLSWNAVQNEGIVSYNAYYGTASQSYSYSQNCGGTNQYLVQGLTAGQTYYFVVAPVDIYGNVGAYSEETNVVAAAPLPIQIHVSAATNALDAVNVSWVPSSDPTVAGFAVYYGDQSGNYDYGYSSYSGVTNGLITGLTAGTTYYFAIAPVDSFGVESIASSEVSFTVQNPAPIALQAQPASKTSGVELSWNASQTDGVVSYNAWYGTSSQDYVYYVNCGYTNKFLMQGLTAGQTYYFAVQPVDGYGDIGAYSQEASAVAAAPLPIQIHASTATNAMDSVNVSWVPGSDPTVTGFAVYYGDQSGNYDYGYDTFYGVTNGLITGLTPGTTYYFAVAPVDSFGVESIASSEVSHTVQAPTPSVLRAHVVTSNPAGVALSWSAITNAGVANYYLFYGTQSGSYDNETAYDCTVTNALINGLNPGQTYYFAVAGADNYGDQSQNSAEVSAVAPNQAPMVLQVQVYSDGNGQPYQLEINTPSTVFGNWEVDTSTNLHNWTPYANGVGSGTGDGYDVDVYMNFDPTQPRVFFRAFTY